ncbi:MAG: hypothetical protein ACLSHX_14575 [Suilimivivens sp.]
MKMTLGTLFRRRKKKTGKAGVPDPLLDARFLLLDVFDMNFASFLVKGIAPLTETENGTNVTEADTDTRKKLINTGN